MDSRSLCHAAGLLQRAARSEHEKLSLIDGDVAAGQLAVFQGGPSRTGGKAPISGFIRVNPPRRRKNSQLAAARRVALKMGRRLGGTYRRIGVSAFAKRRQLSRGLLVITAVSKSGLASPDADTPIRRSADTLPQPTAHFERNDVIIICVRRPPTRPTPQASPPKGQRLSH